MGSSFDSETSYAIKKKAKLKEPEDYQVILLNDDWTSMDFVVNILIVVFYKSKEDAERIMLDVHQKGRAVAGVYTMDIAQTKAAQVHSLAEQHNFPLRCTVEKA